MAEIKIEPSWKYRLKGEFAADYMQAWPISAR